MHGWGVLPGQTYISNGNGWGVLPGQTCEEHMRRTWLRSTPGPATRIQPPACYYYSLSLECTAGEYSPAGHTNQQTRYAWLGSTPWPDIHKQWKRLGSTPRPDTRKTHMMDMAGEYSPARHNTQMLCGPKAPHLRPKSYHHIRPDLQGWGVLPGRMQSEEPTRICMVGEYSPARAIALGKADVIGITTYYVTTYYEPDGWLLIDQRADIWVGSVGVGGLGGERGCGRRLAGALHRRELLAAATSAPSPPGGGRPQRPRAGRRRGGGVSAREKWSRQGGWQAEAEGVGGRGGGERRRGVGRASERKG